jgi:acyl carrier protein
LATSESTVESKLRAYVLENYLFTDDASALDDSDSFMAKGILDSTGIMDMILFIEESFGVHVEDEDMVPENLDSVEKMAAFIRRKQSS